MEKSSKSMASFPSSPSIFRTCPSTCSDGDDSDHFLSPAVEDEKSKEKDMGYSCSASNLESWLDSPPTQLKLRWPLSTAGEDEKSKYYWLDEDDSDYFWLTGVEDEKSKYEKDMGNTRASDLDLWYIRDIDPWRPVSRQGCFKRKILSWKKSRMLGKGSHGCVYEAVTDDGSFFAVKEVALLDQGSQGNRNLLQLEQEINLYRQLEHENIVQYIGTDKDNENLYVFLELMSNGSLSTLYNKRPLTESQVSAYTRQILEGLKYLHDRKVIHRDIKCANILVDASGSVKLAGLGLAKATEVSASKSVRGSPYWMAPEVVNSIYTRSYGLAADIWSLGCTVLEMLTCKPPYYGLEPIQALFRIHKGELPPVPKFLSEDAQDFIRGCLQANPEKRLSAAQLLDHPFVMKPPTSGFARP